MIQVRDVYTLKFGRTDQAVSLFQRMPAVAGRTGDQAYQQHALTDISGPMYTFVSELLVPSLGQWEAGRAKVFDRPGFDEWFKEFQLIVQTGHQDFYTLEAEHPGWSRPGVVVVRECYRALKWQIRPAAGLLQRYGALLEDTGVGRRPRILTDLSGEMFNAILEIEADDLAVWEAMRQELYQRPEFQVWFAQLSSCVESGHHEFYRVEI
ncbi:MAG: hypothetical protein IT317_22375 [Anaerolineales bacterium]|nr:hypothetical protein [Anaerolineales bacterium]